MASGLSCPEETRTQQQFKDECDINTIVKRFGVTGVVPGSLRMATYGDFTDVDDFHTALNAVRSASEAFMALPSELRDRFGNDPQRFVEFCSDARNLDEAKALGLTRSRPAPDINRPVDPPASEVKV